MKHYFLTFIFILSTSNLNAQDAGLKLLIGLSQSEFSSSVYTPDNTSHAGYQFGFEANLNSGPSYMIASLLYQQDNMIAEGNNEHFDHEYSISWIKLRSGIGFRILRFAVLDIHGKVLGAVNAVSDYPQNNNPLSFTDLAPSDLNVVLGLSVRFSLVFVGAEFEKGLTNMVSEENGSASKYDTFTLRAGIFF